MKKFTSKRQTEQRVIEINQNLGELPPMSNFCQEDLFNAEEIVIYENLFVLFFVNECIVLNNSGNKVFFISSLDLRKKFGGKRRLYAAYMKEEFKKFFDKFSNELSDGDKND